MPRKESITKSDILNTAFRMAKTEGFEQVTARKLANEVGCSTQPIFRVYKNMDELGGEVFNMAVRFFDEYYLRFPKKDDTPFVNLGLAYIQFAQNNKNLFRLLFVSENRHGKSLYEILNGTHQAVMNEINRATSLRCTDPQGMFMKMWIFIHGAACMSLTDDYDLGEKETIDLLVNSYHSFDN